MAYAILSPRVRIDVCGCVLKSAGGGKNGLEGVRMAWAIFTPGGTNGLGHSYPGVNESVCVCVCVWVGGGGGGG